MKIGGVVLCGGQSSRMGRPKAWLPIGDEVMLQRVVRIVGATVSPVVVVAAPGQDLPPLPGTVTVVRDEVEGRGPLQGLAAGLDALVAKVDAVFVTGCDTPLLRPEFTQRIVELLGDHDTCVPFVMGRVQPLAGVYRLHVREVIRELLAAEKRSMNDLIFSTSMRMVLAHELTDVDPELVSLRGVNTPDEYAAMLQMQGLKNRV